MLVMTYLQHLDESNREVEVCLVSTDQTEGEEETNRQNGPEVDLASHFYSFSSVNECRRSAEDLGHYGCESHVPCCKDNCWKQLGKNVRTIGETTYEILFTKGQSLTSACIEQAALTETHSIQKVLVEKDNTTTEADPCSVTVRICSVA